MPERESLGDLDQKAWEIGLDGQPADPWQHQQCIVLQSTDDAGAVHVQHVEQDGAPGRRQSAAALHRMQKTHPDELPVDPAWQRWLRAQGQARRLGRHAGVCRRRTRAARLRREARHVDRRLPQRRAPTLVIAPTGRRHASRRPLFEGRNAHDNPRSSAPRYVSRGYAGAVIPCDGKAPTIVAAGKGRSLTTTIAWRVGRAPTPALKTAHQPCHRYRHNGSRERPISSSEIAKDCFCGRRQ